MIWDVSRPQARIQSAVFVEALAAVPPWRCSIPGAQKTNESQALTAHSGPGAALHSSGPQLLVAPSERHMVGSSCGATRVAFQAGSVSGAQLASHQSHLVFVNVT